MTNFSDAWFLRNMAGNQTVFSVETFFVGSGDDLVILSDETIAYVTNNVVPHSVLIFGGGGSDILWSNVGDDFVDGAAGNDILNGGPGNDRITGGAGDDQIIAGLGDDPIATGIDWDQVNGGPGFDRLELPFSISSGDLLINPLGGLSFDITMGTIGHILSDEVEQITFFDGSSPISLTALVPTPIPSSMTLMGSGLGALFILRRKYRKSV